MDRTLTILVVDDDAINQKVLTCVLERHGHKVYAANNSKEAIQIYNTKKLDLIFMDILMPEIDGVDTVKIIRETKGSKNLPNIPIVITTSPEYFSANLKELLCLGVNKCIPKPIDFKALRLMLAEIHLPLTEETEKLAPSTWLVSR